MVNRYWVSMNREYDDSAIAAWKVIADTSGSPTDANDMLFYLFGDGM